VPRDRSQTSGSAAPKFNCPLPSEKQTDKPVRSEFWTWLRWISFRFFPFREGGAGRRGDGELRTWHYTYIYGHSRHYIHVYGQSGHYEVGRDQIAGVNIGICGAPEVVYQRCPVNI